MSKTIVSVERINSVKPHPNADRLDVVQVLGFQVITQKGNFDEGDLAVYFPPDILIPPDVAEEMGVSKFLKHAIFPGDTDKTQCRVGSARIRNLPSHGFCVLASECSIPVKAGTVIGKDVTCYYGAYKYEPPVRLGAGDMLPELPGFHRYTDIENIGRYPHAITAGEQVIISEKIHGTNCRLGLVREDGEFVFCAGSHNQRRKQGRSLYWEFMDENMLNLLTDLCDEKHDVIVFGEIFGPGIQDLDYGQAQHAFRVFDISINGEYMQFGDMLRATDNHKIQTVPILYIGPFSQDAVDWQTYGDTVFESVKSKFKGREGCVIRPIKEQHSDVLGGRLILKSVSADYRDRKGAEDIGE